MDEEHNKKASNKRLEEIHWIFDFIIFPLSLPPVVLLGLSFLSIITSEFPALAYVLGHPITPVVVILTNIGLAVFFALRPNKTRREKALAIYALIVFSAPIVLFRTLLNARPY